MAALFVEFHPAVGSTGARRGPLPATAAEDWQGIYSGGKKVGYAHRVRRPTEDGFAVEHDTLMKLVMMGEPRVVRTHVTAETDRSLALRRFQFELYSKGADFSIRGVATEGGLDLHSSSLGDRSVRLPVAAPIVLSETLQDFLGQERLESGKTLRYALFDPVSGEPAPIELEIGALEEVQLPDGPATAYRVSERFRGSRFELWIDRDGRVLKEEGPLGLTLVRESETKATAGGFESGEGLDLVSIAAIPSSRPIASPRSLEHLTLKLSGIPEGATLSFPPRQTLAGMELRIRREAEASLRSFALPERDPAFTADLASTPFVQSDDGKIRKAAAEALGGETDALRAARKLVDWVYATLDKVPTASVPNALDVLAEKRGDCNEHAVLYVALARAAGLPARMVAGTVYMPAEGGGAGSFFYHAWSEVWLGEWIAVDPTFGQFPADATHVKLLAGGPETHAALLGWIGRLRLEIEDFG
jgi:hypothetical protein